MSASIQAGVVVLWFALCSGALWRSALVVVLCSGSVWCSALVLCSGALVKCSLLLCSGSGALL
jgi:hypothetical protein